MNRVAIHGFGRIGRSTLRIALQGGHFTPVAISDIKDLSVLAALFEVDTNDGRWSEPVSSAIDALKVGNREITYFDSSTQLPDWGSLGVDVVVDCTGRATTRAGAQAHLGGGAKRVRSARQVRPSRIATQCCCPASTSINTIPQRHRDRQHGKLHDKRACSGHQGCPAKDSAFRHGLFSTIHAYTNTQSLTDQPMKDRRDSWAAAENIIPSSSGAARALQFDLARPEDHRQGVSCPGPNRKHRRVEPCH